MWSRTRKPHLFHTLAKDGALYFMVIFTSHIIYTFMLILGRVSDLVVMPAVIVFIRSLTYLWIHSRKFK